MLSQIGMPRKSCSLTGTWMPISGQPLTGTTRETDAPTNYLLKARLSRHSMPTLPWQTQCHPPPTIATGHPGNQPVSVTSMISLPLWTLWRLPVKTTTSGICSSSGKPTTQVLAPQSNHRTSVSLTGSWVHTPPPANSNKDLSKCGRPKRLPKTRWLLIWTLKNQTSTNSLIATPRVIASRPLSSGHNSKKSSLLIVKSSSSSLKLRTKDFLQS